MRGQTPPISALTKVTPTHQITQTVTGSRLLLPIALLAEEARLQQQGEGADGEQAQSAFGKPRGAAPARQGAASAMRVSPRPRKRAATTKDRTTVAPAPIR